MSSQPQRQGKLTVEDFFDAYTGAEDKLELVDGEVVMMAGASVMHNRVATRLLVAVAGQLRGSGCEPFGSDMGLRIDRHTLRYPDLAVYCDADELGGDGETTQSFQHPRMIFEVLSPGTQGRDKSSKLMEYKGVASARTIVLIDPRRRLADVWERVSETEWRSVTLLPGAPLVLRNPDLTITAETLFDGL